MDNGNVIRPLILEESANDAEALASALRNAGYAVRFKHIEDSEGLEEALASKNWDLLLTAQKVGDLSANQAISIIKKAGKDIPCIVMGGDHTDATVTEYLQAGAVDYITGDAQNHLLLVIQREFENC